jgi:hypothetical protein
MRIENGLPDGRPELASGRAGFRFVAPGYRFAPGFARFVACPLSTNAAATKVRIEHGRKALNPKATVAASKVLSRMR